VPCIHFILDAGFKIKFCNIRRSRQLENLQSLVGKICLSTSILASRSLMQRRTRSFQMKAEMFQGMIKDYV